MNQSTSNTKPALEGAANGEAPAKSAGQPRRYRRPSRAKSAATSQAATPVSTATAAAPAETPPPAPAKTVSARTPATSRSDRSRGDTKAQPEAPATPPPAKAAEPAEARPRARNQRNTRRNKGEVHLVVPPAGAGNGNEAEAKSLPIPSEAFTLPAPVPVLTVKPTAAELEPTEVVGAPQAPVQEPASTTRRYRFNRPAAGVVTAPQQTIRPERLSGLLSNPQVPETTVPVSQVEAPEAEAESEPFDLFGPRPAGTYSRGSASDDILSELGLREARDQAAAAKEEAEPYVEEPVEDRNNHTAAISAVAADEHHDAETEELPEADSPEGDAGVATRRRRRRRRSTPHVATPAEEMPDDRELSEPSWDHESYTLRKRRSGDWRHLPRRRRSVRCSGSRSRRSWLRGSVQQQ